MTIKIISLNIWLGGRLQDSAVAFLKAQSADLIVLQEVFNGEDASLGARYRTMQVLREQLGFPYEVFSPNYDQPDKNADIGNAIFSRFPVVAVDNHNQSYNLQHVVMSTTNDEIEVLNLHGPWDLDGDNFSSIRQEMSSRILQATKGKRRIVLAGDTNAKPTNKGIVAIGEQLKSVFGYELTTTFNMLQKDNVGYAFAAVDMMFVSKNIRIIEHSCPDVNISDHLPLVAILEIG
jgi:endonuclease/exonuclease/phosphatase family metal-dependent hydrolase